MKPTSLLMRWAVLCGLLAAVLIVSPSVSPVRADVDCVATIPITDGTDDNIGFDLKLVGKSLVWFKTTGELFLFNLKTNETRQIGVMNISKNDNGRHFALDKKHIVWVDSNLQVQLYNIRKGTTTQLSNGQVVTGDPDVEGRYVTWRQGKSKEKRNKLMVHDIKAGTATRIGKTYSYSLNEGRVLWGGNLTELANGKTTVLSEGYWTALNGAYAAGIHAIPSQQYPGSDVPVLMLKDLRNGTVTQLSEDYYRAGLLDEFALYGDYVGYTVTGVPISVRTFHLYQISTGTEQTIGYKNPVFDRPAGFLITDRFLGWNDSTYDGVQQKKLFYVYDRATGTASVMLHNSNANSERGVISLGRIAWVEYQVDANDAVFDTQVILRTGCYSS
jgi:hypothetical protein